MQDRGLGRRRSCGTAGLHRLSAIVVAFSALGTFGACGDGGEGDRYPAGVTQPLSKVEFLREADRICRSSESRIEAAADGLLAGRGRPDPAEVKQVALAVAVPALETEVRAIRALGAPSGDSGEVEAILAATERGVAEIKADPAALADGPPAALRRAQRLAEQYGSTQCGFR